MRHERNRSTALNFKSIIPFVEGGYVLRKPILVKIKKSVKRKDGDGKE
jgi:hypothetical protein